MLSSVRAIVDRAREHLSVAELPRLVMNDPGHASYVVSYARILEGGVQVLRDDDVMSFEITENLLQSHARAGESSMSRWFSVLTACLELLGAGAARGISLSATLSVLLADGFALEDARVAGAPLDLLPPLFQELKQMEVDYLRVFQQQ
jgi:hypothetical protein